MNPFSGGNKKKSKKYAVVNQKVCVACGACYVECPRNAIRIWKSCYAKIDADLCIGCGRCEAICPACSIDLKKRED